MKFKFLVNALGGKKGKTAETVKTKANARDITEADVPALVKAGAIEVVGSGQAKRGKNNV